MKIIALLTARPLCCSDNHVEIPVPSAAGGLVLNSVLNINVFRSTFYGQGPLLGCILRWQSLRALTFCSGTITYCLEIIFTSSPTLKMFFATRPLPLINLKMAQSKAGAFEKAGMDFRIVSSGPVGSTEFHKTCVNFYSFLG